MDSVTDIGAAGLTAVGTLAGGLAGVLLAYAGIRWGFAAGKWVIAKISTLFGK